MLVSKNNKLNKNFKVLILTIFQVLMNKKTIQVALTKKQNKIRKKIHYKIQNLILAILWI
jgi:hypothetical protein